MSLFHLKQKDVPIDDFSSLGLTASSDGAILNNQDFDSTTNISHENSKRMKSLESEALSPELADIQRVNIKVREIKKENFRNSGGWLLSQRADSVTAFT